MKIQKNRAKKSQVWYLDFMVGVFIFVTLIVIYYQYYGNFVDDSEVEWQEIIIDSKAISSILISAGYPADWTNDTVSVIGLTDGNYRINFTKLARLKNMSYKQAKDVMRTRFEFYFFIENQNGTVVDSAGMNATDHLFLVQTTRFVIYNSSVSKMVLHVWK